MPRKGRYKVESQSRSGVPYTVGRDDCTKSAIKLAEMIRLTTGIRSRIYDTQAKKYLTY